MSKAKQKNKNTSIRDREKTIVENKIFNYSLILAFVIFLSLLTTFKISGDDDVFWHLATGRYVLENGVVPSTDVFGFVTQGQEWMPFEWGWDVITYLIYNIGGYTGLSIFRTLIFLAIFFVYFLILRKFNVSYFLMFLFFIVISFGIIDRLSPRPHIASLLFFVMLLYLFINYKYFNRSNIKQLYFVPLIFLLWANIHMGIIAGIFLFGIFVLSETIIYLKPQKYSSKEIMPLTKSEITKLYILFVISLVLMLVNPNGISTYFYAYSHTKMKLLETINEWRSPFDSTFSGGFVTLIYELFLFGGVIILYYAFKKKDLFPALLYLGFAIYSVRAVRFTVDFIVITSVFFIIALSYFIYSLKSNEIKNFINIKSAPKIVLIVILLFFLINIPNNKLYLDHLQYYRITGFGINSDFIPTQLFDFMKENKIAEIGEKPLNHFGTGGFLVWNFPNAKNFIDSRNLNDNIFNEYSNLMSKKPGFEKKLNDYNFDYAIYLAPDLVRAPQEMEQTIISYLSKKSDEWKLVFWDDKSFLFVKNIPKFKDIIDKYEYKYLTPYTVGYQKNIFDKNVSEKKEEVKKELQRKMNEEPNGFIINNVVQRYSKLLQ